MRIVPALLIQPEPGASFSEWRRLAQRPLKGALLGRPHSEWRELTRRELGLDESRPIIATGHQTLLWHPGILAKYIALDAAVKASSGGFASANLIVDQHVGDFGSFDVPTRRADNTLAVSRIVLAQSVRPDVPMAMHEPLTPEAPKIMDCTLESVGHGVDRIIAAISAHRSAPNAAIQMCRALDGLMRRWVGPIPSVTASALCETSLARVMIERMIEDPRACVAAYNRAVATVPEAGIGPLAVARDAVELPLWRVDSSGRRVRALVREVQEVLAATGQTLRWRLAAERLMPRALFMTALVRLGMCDLYVHGTGGARYDRAMEIWIHDWLDGEVAPIAVVSADLHLPLMTEEELQSPEAALHTARQVWHDPESAADSLGHPGERKRAMLKRIAHLPRNSIARKSAFFQMHEVLEQLREEHQPFIDAVFERVKIAKRHAADAKIASRRDWAFPLYPESSIDALAEAIRLRAARWETVAESS